MASILGTAQNFAALGASTVTNTGATIIVGDVGVSPGTAITGFPPGVVTAPGTIDAGDAVASQAHADLATAYGVIAGEASPPANNLTGQDLGGLTLTPGVYHFDTSATLTGTLTLDAQGDPNARFDFQIGTTLITASGSAIQIINGGVADNVYFQVGSSATLGTNTAFEGNILADQSVTLTTGASMQEGRALALVGAVTMDTNQVSAPLSATEADVSVTKTAAAGPVTAGDTIAYTITVANAGPSDAQAVDMTDLVPADTTFISDAQTAGPAFVLINPPAGGTGTISGTIGTLALGASATFTVVLQVSPSTPDGTTITNTADVTASTADPNLANNSQSVTTDALTQADLSLTKTTASGTVIAGDTIAYTITVANAGPSDAQAVDMTDLVPADTTFISDAQTAGPAFVLINPPAGGTGTISGTIGTLALGASATFTVVVRVSPSTLNDGATIANTADVTAVTSDPNLANNSQSVTTDALTQADLSLTKTTAAGPVTAGDTIAYTITVANAGPSDAQAVDMTDLVPADTTFVSDAQTAGPAFVLINPPAGGTGTISGTIGTLALGASATFTVVLQVSPSTPDGTTITNTADVTASTADPNLANNSQSVTTDALTQADLSLTKTTASGTVIAGDTIAYTITVANAGPSDAQAVDMTDLVPADTTFISDAQTAGPAFVLINPPAGGTGTISGTIGTLALGASATFTVVLQVSPSLLNDRATIANTATVTAATSDPNLANNNQTVTTGVLTPVTPASPAVVDLQRFGFHDQPTVVVVSFSTSLDAARAQDVANYRIVTLGGPGRGGSLKGHVTRVSKAVYNAATKTVTLHTAQRLDIHNVYRITITGAAPGGLMGTNGMPLDGADTGTPGSNFVGLITDKTLAGPSTETIRESRAAKAGRPRAVHAISASAIDSLAVAGRLGVREHEQRRSSDHGSLPEEAL